MLMDGLIAVSRYPRPLFALMQSRDVSSTTASAQLSSIGARH